MNLQLGSLLLSITTLALQIAPSLGAIATISSSPAQTFEGIGGSSAWWPNDLINFPLSVRENLSALLWSPDGLHLSSYRWNLGGGGLGVTANPVRAIETFYVSQGVYNWSADPGGRYFLSAASNYSVPIITAFVNSAPHPFTTNNLSCAGNFATGTEAAYGKYIADVIGHFRSVEGVNVSYVSLFNEPDDSFGPVPCGQEGMEVTPSQRAAVINGTYHALAAAGLGNAVGIMADESSSLTLAENEYATWLPTALDQVAVLCHHTYNFPTNSEYEAYIGLVAENYPSKKTWNTEICCSVGSADASNAGYSGGYDPTITNALQFSSLMFQSLVVAGEAHYDFWTVVSSELGCEPLTDATCATTANSNGWTDGLIYYDPEYATNGNYELYLTKHYWTMKHFGNLIRPGSVRYPVTSSSTEVLVARTTATSNTYVVMVINAYNSTLSLPLSTSALGTWTTTAGYRTSASEDFTTLAGSELPRVLSNGTVVLTLPGLSLGSWVFTST